MLAVHAYYITALNTVQSSCNNCKTRERRHSGRHRSMDVWPYQISLVRSKHVLCRRLRSGKRIMCGGYRREVICLEKRDDFVRAHASKVFACTMLDPPDLPIASLTNEHGNETAETDLVFIM